MAAMSRPPMPPGGDAFLAAAVIVHSVESLKEN